MKSEVTIDKTEDLSIIPMCDMEYGVLYEIVGSTYTDIDNHIGNVVVRRFVVSVNLNLIPEDVGDEE